MDKPLLERPKKQKTYQIKVMDFTIWNGFKFGMGFALGSFFVYGIGAAILAFLSIIPLFFTYQGI